MCGHHPGVDVLELGVAVGMFRALIRLAVNPGREKPSLTSSLRTLLGLIAWPMSPSACASLSRWGGCRPPQTASQCARMVV